MVEDKIPKSQIEVVKSLAKERWKEQAELFEFQAEMKLHFMLSYLLTKVSHSTLSDTKV